MTASPVELLLRFAIVSAAVLWIANQAALPVADALLPAVRRELILLDDNLAIGSLEVAPVAASPRILLRANTLRPIYFRSFVIYPLGWRPGTAGWYQIDSSARGLLLAPAILLIALLGWPWRSLRELAARLGLGALLLGVLLALDVPLDLLGNFERFVMNISEAPANVPLFVWDRFLEGGGGAALAVAFAALAIGVPRRGFAASPPPRGPLVAVG